MHSLSVCQPKDDTFGSMSDSHWSFISSCGRKDHVVVGSLSIKWKPNVKWHDRDPCRRRAGLDWVSQEINTVFLKKKIDPLCDFSVWLQWEERILQSATAWAQQEAIKRTVLSLAGEIAQNGPNHYLKIPTGVRVCISIKKHRNNSSVVKSPQKLYMNKSQDSLLKYYFSKVYIKY